MADSPAVPKTIAVKVDEELHAELVALAAADDRTLGAYCKRALKEHSEAHAGYIDQEDE